MAQVNREIGEALVCWGDDEHVVRPSFRALSAVDDLNWSVERVCEAYTLMVAGHFPSLVAISCCASVLRSCSTLDMEWIGWIEERAKGLKWREGRIPVDDMIILAHHCVKWGVYGNPKEKLSRAAKKKLDDQPRRDFDPAEYVAIMVDEFGLTSSDAWDSTMTEFQRICEHRNRKNWGDRPEPIDDDERDTLVDAYQQFLKNKRARKDG